MFISTQRKNLVILTKIKQKSLKMNNYIYIYPKQKILTEKIFLFYFLKIFYIPPEKISCIYMRRRNSSFMAAN